MIDRRWVTLGVALIAGCTTVPLDLGGGRGNGQGTHAVPFDMGPRATCFASSDGVLRCIGTGEAGRFGVDTAMLPHLCDSVPCAMEAPWHVADDEGAIDPRAPAVGENFLCALVEGQVLCRGGNAWGTLGRGTHDRDSHENALPVDDARVFVEVVAGRGHVCARTDDGQVACWGLGTHGQLGADPNTLDECGTPHDDTEATRMGVTLNETYRCSREPRNVVGLTGVIELRAGPFSTCARDANGWRCIGRNRDGGLGVGTEAGVHVHEPTSLQVTDAVAVAHAADHGCAVDVQGRTRCFGRGALGELGLGDNAPDSCDGEPCALQPARVIDLPSSAVDVTAGTHHTCVLLAAGNVQCFGSDAFGQLGDSAGSPDTCEQEACARSPVTVALLDNAVALQAEDDATCATTRSDTIVCWGDGRYGNIGARPPGPLPFPNQIYGIPGAP